MVREREVGTGKKNPLKNKGITKVISSKNRMPESSQRSHQDCLQAKTSSAATHERKLQEEGFETWRVMRKSFQKKKGDENVICVQKGELSRKRDNDIQFDEVHNRLRKENTKCFTEEECTIQQPLSAAAWEEEGEGTVVISSEEYRMLQSLKEEWKGRIMNRSVNVSAGDFAEEAAFMENTNEEMNCTPRNDRSHRSMADPHEDHRDMYTDIQNNGSDKEHPLSFLLVDSCDNSDFEDIPQEQPVIGQKATVHEVISRQNVVVDLPQHESGKRVVHTEEAGRLKTAKEKIEGRTATMRQEVTPLKSTYVNSSRRRHFVPDPIGFFPFQTTVEEDNLEGGGVLAMSKHSVQVLSDNDCDEPSSKYASGSETSGKRTLIESEARANRKRKRVERELAMQKREAAGEKPYYIMVSASGTPYGDGMIAWRAEVNKLARGLDPTIRDIRQQPHQKIQLLKKRLTDNFQYSGVISDKYLLPLLGHRVSSRRNDLINRIRRGLPCPSGFNEDMWITLENISKSPNFKRKSEAMQYANSCRQSLGRTGPGGEIAIRESLKQTLCRSPDPEEVQAEMIRDKGYGGRKAWKKVNASKSAEVNDSGRGTYSKTSMDLQVAQFVDDSEDMIADSDVDIVKGTYNEQLQMLRNLQSQMDELKGRLTSTLFEAFSGKGVEEIQSPALTVKDTVLQRRSN